MRAEREQFFATRLFRTGDSSTDDSEPKASVVAFPCGWRIREKR